MKKSCKVILAASALLMLFSATDAFAAKKKDAELEMFKKQPLIKKPLKNAKGKKYDLGGMEVIIADWWSPTEVPEPTTAFGESQRKWLNLLEETYNFKIKQIGIDGWGKHPQTFVQFANNGGPENYVFVLYQNSLSAQMKAGFFYDLATLPSMNGSVKGCLGLEDPMYQKSVTEMLSVGNHIYGMRAIEPEPRGCLFFNKRMLKEAGVDPESIYDMQKAGTWTWNNFDKLCAKLTRDTNNDGVTDVYALTSFSKDYFDAVVASNGAMWVDKDENGKFINGTTSDAFLEALNWGQEIINKYEMPAPEGAAWDYAKSSFINGEACMQVAQEYYSGSFKDMKDDYGMVCFPKGPRVSTYNSYFQDNVYVIPSCYDADRADKIALAYYLYNTPVPGYDDDEGWKNAYYEKYRDARAVDESVALLIANGQQLLTALAGGLDEGDIIYDVYGNYATPAEKIEEVKNKWDAILDEVNGAIK